ncbi:MAG: TIGR00374 family protein [Flavobacteriales bacterium CG11_big_fil_rev_8_21_14_0_20_35_7]|nr:MAG: TIGR00374 family protein [Flavobacteriales bacterium CG11_big_fil_rev_8_21_14_0_20_35_7]
MLKKLRKIVFISLPILFGFGLIWYSFSKFTPSDIESMTTSFKTAHYGWVLLSIVFAILSHFSRAYRWQFLLEPLGYKPKFTNSLLTIMVAYLLNLVIPRSGEVARAATISKYENIPFQKAFGTIVAERVADVIMLFSIIGIAFIMQTKLLSQYLFKDNGANPWHKFIILGSLMLVAGVIFILFKKSKLAIVLKIKEFLKGLLEGMMSIVYMKKKFVFILHTFLIWTLYVLMFYVVTFAFPETANLPFGAIIVGFVIGGLSMALTNGGLGTYPIFVASAFILYGVENNPARAFGWIVWTSQTLMVLFFGGLAFIILPIYNRKKV